MTTAPYDEGSFLAFSGRLSRALTRAFFDLAVLAISLVLGLGAVVFTLWTGLSLLAATAGHDPASWPMFFQALELSSICLVAEFMLVAFYFRVRSSPFLN